MKYALTSYNGLAKNYGAAVMKSEREITSNLSEVAPKPQCQCSKRNPDCHCKQEVDENYHTVCLDCFSGYHELIK